MLWLQSFKIIVLDYRLCDVRIWRFQELQDHKGLQAIASHYMEFHEITKRISDVKEIARMLDYSGLY